MIKKAFTLSEVLMVIGIIGVVAAITIPNLSQNIDSEKNIAKLRSVVEDINVAIGKVNMEEESLMKVCTYSDVSCMGQKIAAQMKSPKKCGSDTGCFIGGYDQFSCNYSFTLANGASVCTIPPPYHQNHRWMLVDVDGSKKGTNTYGEDQFLFEMSDDGLEFMTSDGRASRRMFARGSDEAEWAMVVGNQDYLNCPDVLQWGVKEGCQ